MAVRALGTAALGFVALTFLGASHPPDRVTDVLSLEARVSARRAIEEIRWSHRLWPSANPGPKPPLSAFLTDDELRRDVLETDRKEAALRAIWGQPVDPEQVQAELDRMAAHSRAPERLAEMFAALGNDPRLIAETLARPALVNRLLRHLHDSGPRLDGVAPETFDTWWAGQSRALPEPSGEREENASVYRIPPIAVPSCTDDTWSDLRRPVPFPRSGAVAVWTGSEMILWGGRYSFGTLGTGDRYDPATDTWSTVRADGTTPSPRITSGVWTGTEMIVWGGGAAGTEQAPQSPLSSGGRYNPATDTWVPTRLDASTPAPRSAHLSVWTGTEMIVWGGQTGTTHLATGGRYNPVTDTWTPTRNDLTTPAARSNARAVWTGQQMLLWGGLVGTHFSFGDGSRYTPATDTWTPISTAGAPQSRTFHSMAWTGSEAIVWGGVSYGFSNGQITQTILNTGGRYDPASDTWSATRSDATAPAARAGHGGVWTGSEMIVFGGPGGGSRYSPASDTWTPLPAYPASFGPAPWSAIWTGQEVIVFGGIGNEGIRTGGRFNPATNAWLPLPVDGAPEPRDNHTTVWTGNEMIVWGGVSKSGPYNQDGGRYDPATDSWEPTRLDATTPVGRVLHTAVWTGQEMIVWGGDSGGNTGGRYNPATDTWIATPVNADTPPARTQHTAVWTGTEMIVWGGSLTNTGGRFNPTTNTWNPTRADGSAPSARVSHRAVWTGKKMIVWGGNAQYPTVFNSGGLYDPNTDTWTPTRQDSTTPSARNEFAAVWTGYEMIVWGGGSTVQENTGGRYNPASDTWSPTPIDAATPLGRLSHVAVWNGGEMIVWGGDVNGAPVSSGGRYDPYRGIWRSTRLDSSTPAPQDFMQAVWGGSQMLLFGPEAARYCAQPASPPDADGDTVPDPFDNCPAAANQNQGDLDGDGVGDVCDPDLDGDGRPNATDCAPADASAQDPVTAELTGLTIAPGPAFDLWTWTAPTPPPPTSWRYRVLGGTLAQVHADGGLASIACVSAPLQTASWQDTSVPVAGEGLYYLVRLDNACGPGPTGHGSSGAVRPSPVCP